MTTLNKILIGGAALRELGSVRHTDDLDYLVWMDDNFTPFHTSEGVDLINANSTNFFESIYNIEKGKEIASPQSLFDLKAFALIEHMRNGNFNKVNDCRYDLNFLKINFGIEDINTLKKYITKAEHNEILSNLNSNLAL